MADTAESRRLADELAADVAALLREGLPQEALRAEAAQGMLRDLGDAIESRDAKIAELRAQVEALKSKSAALWMLLDDIDTQDDASKDSDKHFRDCVRAIQQRRWHFMSGEDVDAARSQEAAR